MLTLLAPLLLMFTVPVKSLPLARLIAPAPPVRVTRPAPDAWVMVPLAPSLMPAPDRLRVLLPTLTVPRVKALLPLTKLTAFVPLLLKLTAPWKLLPASFRVMLAAPAVMLDVPTTLRPPAVSLMAPVPPLLATRLPPMLPVPRLRAPVEIAVRLVPMFSVLQGQGPGAGDAGRGTARSGQVHGSAEGIGRTGGGEVDAASAGVEARAAGSGHLDAARRLRQMALPLLVAVMVPPMLPSPTFRAPWEIAVRLVQMFRVPRVKAPALVMLAVLPPAVDRSTTMPPKVLAAPLVVRSMLPTPALKLEVPVLRLPPGCRPPSR